MATLALDQKQPGSQTRAFAIAWAFTTIFYFLEYAVRSSPAVMIPQLEASFHTTALGISAILGAYYYTYSTMSLVAGAALDRLGAKRTVPVGAAILGIGCLFFSGGSVLAGDVGRLLQGAGSAFAFTGAVYLASHGFSSRYLATAIGATQCVGMLGGSAGQFAVGPMIEHGLAVHTIWIGLGIVILANAALLYVTTPKEQSAPRTQEAGFASVLKPYKIVFSNPQSYLCGLDCRAAVRADYHWRHDLGRSCVSKRYAIFLSQRGDRRLYGSARLGFWVPVAGMAFGPHRKAQAGDHRECGGHDSGRDSAGSKVPPGSAAFGHVCIWRRVRRSDDSLQRDQRSESRQREGQRDWRN